MTNKERVNELISKDKRKIRTSINYNIMADKRREDYIPYLHSKLGYTKVIWDKKRDIIDTRIRCFEDHIKSGKEFGITVQDDSIVTDNFKVKAKEYIEKIGDKEGIYNFYYATKNPRDIIKQKLNKGSYIITDEDYHEIWRGKKYTLHNEICFAMPVKYMKEMIKYLKKRELVLPGGRRTDAIMQWWIVDNNIPVYFPLPSIIDHRAYASSLHLQEKTPWAMCWWFDTDDYPRTEKKSSENKEVSRFNYNIMAHQLRKKLIPYLKGKIGDVNIIWDKHNFVWDTRKACLRDHYDSGAQFGITIQDDAILCENFKERAEKFINEIGDPDAIYNFYYPRRRSSSQLEEAINKGQNYILEKNVYAEVAIAVPTKKIPHLIECCDRQRPKADEALGFGYAKNNNINVYFSVPSLADHRTDINSVYRGEPGGHRKKAWWFADNEYKGRNK